MTLEIVGIVGLILWFAICIPTYKHWSYKENYKRSMKQLYEVKRKEQE